MSEVAAHRQRNVAALSSRVLATILCFPLCRCYSSVVSRLDILAWWRRWIYNRHSIGTCGGSNGVRYKWPAEPAVPATTCGSTYVHMNRTDKPQHFLNPLVWGSLTLTNYEYWNHAHGTYSVKDFIIMRLSHDSLTSHDTEVLPWFEWCVNASAFI